MQPTSIAGRYRVERAVGHGGMGTVWLCRDEVLGRQVAVKQVGAMPGETTSDVNRALREARSSAALNHRNVVSIYDAVEDGDRNWLVMEYVASRDLGKILSSEGVLPPERVTWIGLQAAEGLTAAHARGTMHRDVKPSNILVTDDDLVKITDFGISRTHGDIRLTSTGLITGTPAYFAPEIARGEEPGLPADVWALGASLYRAVEGETPFPEQGNPLALLTSIAKGPVPRPRRAGTLTEAITRMLEPDPADRWTMDEAVQALRLLHQRPPTAGARPTTPTLAIPTPTPIPEPTPEPTPEPAPEPTPEPTVDSTVERPVDSPTEEPRRRRGWLLPVAVVVILALLVGGGVLLLGDDGGEPTSADPGTSAAPSPRTGTPESEDPPASVEPTPEPTAEPTPTATPTRDPKPSPTTSKAPAAGDVEAFGERYYGLLPDDTSSAYALLSPSYGTTFGQYDGFWRTISDVSVRGVTAVDDSTVDVDLTYTSSDGTREDETRRLFLEATDDGYLIASDAAV